MRKSQEELENIFNKQNQDLQGAAKAVLKKKFIALNAYSSKKKKFSNQ